MANTVYDIIIIGGGPAGLTAALYGARSNLKVLVIEKMMPGGQAAITESIENYPGFPQGIAGFELGMKLHEQAGRFGAEMVVEEVVELQLAGQPKVVKTTQNTYEAKAVILATGAKNRALGCPGEEQFRGRGVSYCATCDGAFFTGKKVVVVGGGNSAVEEAVYLTKFAEKVTIIHRRDTLRADKVVQEKAFNEPKIDFLWNKVVVEITGQDQVTGVVVQDTVTGEKSTVATDGVFVFVGMEPQTALVAGQVELTEDGYIRADESTATNLPGVFAAGDVRKKPLRQVVTAVADGAVAAMAAEKYVENLK
ncbi:MULTISPECIES: thioredoxin-disulfide reductase [Carboxydocella]|uniref:Thioredoxin reductase n=2 Tax=Carboxydocella TaxID=178898 RepID=A0A1T4PNE8_9FIRM|nr:MULTISPECIES: thioredoxin-disulfide reductase [Carboxydocella]AVX19464.1 thioredoxin reductase (NADPH) [Carboxydocella thermautotrophica]AVX29881.1 thioredoxin reductase (NADPH) [Carboxydocella thermautotrophica]SJZ92737.1 thioredoxin reductase (NADPH) [Carboxydocella sporoproducens DSM 16521]GAW29057.1 thioredoxin-disulfide reductase [Carboxydocella sp. ULO1]GAW30790.1 thioredoxin-disulfide reductase [Carboxydocella sp. JDF658]